MALLSLIVFIGFQSCIELFFRKVHLRKSCELCFDKNYFLRNFSIKRSFYKFFGFTMTLATLAFCYSLFPIYEQQEYQAFWDLAKLAGPIAYVLSFFYFIFVDAIMKKPKDGYWQAALFFNFKWKDVNWSELVDYAKGWIIKGFFLPLLYPSLENAIQALALDVSQLDFSSLTIIKIVFLFSTLAFSVDLIFVVSGYFCTLRILDTHIRSTNPYFWGWVFTLIAYFPFANLVKKEYLNFNDHVYWYEWFGFLPYLLIFWGSLIIVTKISWAWANMMFGLRFSNLTHRGIITNGPYRFTKHPSYVSKNIYWWLASVPFLSTSGWFVGLQHCVALLAVNLIYILRAKAEEFHLSKDPTYVQYALWIEKHGLFRFVDRLIPFLKFKIKKEK